MSVEHWMLSFGAAFFEPVRFLAFTGFWQIAGLAAGVAGVVLLIFIALFIGAAMDRKEEQRFKDTEMPALAAEFGTLVSLADRAFSFERNGMVFDAGYEFKTTHFAKGSLTEIVFSAAFDLPQLKERFYIEHEAAMFTKFPAGCPPVVPAAAPEGFVFHSPDTEFLLSLLENEKIQTEIRRYPKDWLNRFWIVFEDGRFDLTWRAAGDRARQKTDSLRQVCRTAVVFCEELSEKS